MYPEKIPENPFTTTLVRVQYDCCGKLHTLKWKDADKNFQKNGGRHICRTCGLKTDNPARRQEVKEKIRQTNISKYGVACPLNTAEATAARVEKMFGTEEAVQKIVANRRKTSQERYGADHIMKTEEGVRRVRETMQEKYGVNAPLQSEEVRERMRQTCQERYGVDNVCQVPEVRMKMAQTTLERYGVEYYNQLPEMKDYLKENCTAWLADSYANPWAKGITRPEEWNEKQRETVLGLIDDGKWNVGPKYSIKGKYNSRKCRRPKPMFRSSYELKTHWHLDNDPAVEWYDYEPFRVPYLDADGKRRYYVVDFLVKYVKNQRPLALEVKNDYNKERFVESGKQIAFQTECGGALDFTVWSNDEIKALNLDLEVLLASDLVERC